MRGAGHEAFMVTIRNAFRILVGKPKEKMQLRRPRCAEGNIKMYLREDID
jgi:hypothetical protein